MFTLQKLECKISSKMLVAVFVYSETLKFQFCLKHSSYFLFILFPSNLHSSFNPYHLVLAGCSCISPKFQWISN